MIEAKPTLYSGIRFRSRLEARWACFFDEVGWGWEYEPMDCEGWTPDFLIRARIPILVEVKPISRLTATEPLPAEARKVLRAPPDHWALLLGVSPFVADCSISNAGLGLVWHLPKYNQAVVSISARGGLTFSDDREDVASPVAIRRLWAKATNATQWAAAEERKAEGDAWRRRVERARW